MFTTARKKHTVVSQGRISNLGEVSAHFVTFMTKEVEDGLFSFAASSFDRLETQVVVPKVK